MTVRGCGTRALGGVYIEVHLVQGGSPLEKFMVDPVREIPEGLDIPDRGVAIVERVVDGQKSDIFDVYDKIGRQHYPNVTDFIYETRKKGVSRRLSSTTDFSRLTKESRLVLVHASAILENANVLYGHIATEMREMVDANHWRCPCGKPGHDQYPSVAAEDAMPTCIGALNEVVAGGDEIYDPAYEPRAVRRQIGNLTYLARHAPLGFRPEYEAGIFMVLPISNIAVIRDPESSKHVPALERAANSGLDVTLEDA